MRSFAVGLLVAGGVLVGSAPLVSSSVSAEETCSSTTYTWSGNRLLMRDLGFDQFNTGVVVPAPAASETLVVASATYHAYDRYPDGSTPSRAEAGQVHEQFALKVGGVQVGSLTPDVPNGVAEGAPTDWYSGELIGSFGSGATLTGGELVLVHSSQFGFSETPNSLYAVEVSVTVRRCVVPEVTVAPSEVTVAPSEVTVAPTIATTTTTTPSSVSVNGPTPPAATTTTTTTSIVSNNGPVPSVTSTTVVGNLGPTPPAANPALPATGRGVERQVQAGLVVFLSGALLLLASRPRRVRT